MLISFFVVLSFEVLSLAYLMGIVEYQSVIAIILRSPLIDVLFVVILFVLIITDKPKSDSFIYQNRSRILNSLILAVNISVAVLELLLVYMLVI